MIAARTPIDHLHVPSSQVEQGHRRHPSPTASNKPKLSLLWMTTSKDYRPDADDGVLTALLLGPATAASMLYGTFVSEHSTFYPRGWLIEAPKYLHKSIDPIPPREALLNSRRSLVQLSTLCAFVLLTHMCTSRVTKTRQTASTNSSTSTTEPENKSRRGWRSWNFVGYATLISMVAVAFHVGCSALGLEVWKGWLKA